MSEKLFVLISNEITEVNGIITGHNKFLERTVKEASGMEIEGFTICPIYLTIGDGYSIQEKDGFISVTAPPSLEVKKLGFINADLFPFCISLNPFDLKLLRMLNNLDIHVVHTTSPYGKTDITAKILAARRKLPHVHLLITTFHDYFGLYTIKIVRNVLDTWFKIPDIVRLTERLPILGIITARLATTIYRYIPDGFNKVVHGLLGRFTKAVICGADRVLYPNPLELKALIEKGLDHTKARQYMIGLDKEKFSVGPDRTHSSSNYDGEIGTSDNPAQLVFTGRIQDEKNVMRLADIVEGCQERGIYVHLTIIGAGYRIEDMKKRLNDNIRITGQISHDEIVQILRNSDIYIHPALHECYGMVLAEAKACGLPLIGYAHAGSSTIHIKEGYNGLCVSNDIKKEWVDATERLVTDKGLRKRMGQNSREDVDRRYLSPNDVVRKQIASIWVEVYKERMSPRKRINSPHPTPVNGLNT